MKEIRIPCFILRPFQASDNDDLFEFLFQLENNEFEGYPGITYENGRQHLNYRLGTQEFYAIELLATGKVIGNIYCGNRDFEAKEAGYIINKNYQRKGYAAEALSAVMEQAFSEGVHRVYAECDPRNVPCWKLLKKGWLKAGGAFQAEYLFPKG